MKEDHEYINSQIYAQQGELTTEEYAILKELTIQEINIYEHSKTGKAFYDKLLSINEKLEKKILTAINKSWEKEEKNIKKCKKELGWD